GLGYRGRQITGSLPGGWNQRVAFGAAIMHEPRVLFLDEPTSGVDPIARRAFWAMINQLADQGTAILVTTHYLEEAEQCNRLGFMVAGELVTEGTPSGVKAAQGGRVLEVLADDPQRAVALLKTALEPWRVSLFGDRFHVIVDGDAQAAARDLTALMGTSVSLTVTDIPIVIQDFDQTQMSRRYADAFRTSLTYRVVSLPPATSPETMLAGGRARAAVIIPEHFEREIRRHRPVE